MFGLFRNSSQQKQFEKWRTTPVYFCCSAVIIAACNVHLWRFFNVKCCKMPNACLLRVLYNPFAIFLTIHDNVNPTSHCNSTSYTCLHKKSCFRMKILIRWARRKNVQRVLSTRRPRCFSAENMFLHKTDETLWVRTIKHYFFTHGFLFHFESSITLILKKVWN